MTEKPAKGVRGHLLWDNFLMEYVFRVYGEADEQGRRPFTDYDLKAEDIQVEVLSGNLSLHGAGWLREYPELDWASSYTGKKGKHLEEGR